MGNCQAAEVAAVVVQHPGNRKIDRMYWTITAHDVMNSNPGYYVALVLHSSANNNNNNNINKTKEQPSLKLLKPTDTLHLGHLYRLISFEDVIKEFAAKKSVKLGKLLKVDSAAARSTFHHNQDLQTGIIIGRGIKKGGLYYVEEVSQNGCATLARGSMEDQLWKWHRRLGHPSLGINIDTIKIDMDTPFVGEE